MPSSSAPRMASFACSTSIPPPSPPACQVPKQMRETFRSVCPSRVYSIASPFFNSGSSNPHYPIRSSTCEALSPRAVRSGRRPLEHLGRQIEVRVNLLHVVVLVESVHQPHQGRGVTGADL